MRQINKNIKLLNNFKPYLLSRIIAFFDVRINNLELDMLKEIMSNFEILDYPTEREFLTAYYIRKELIKREKEHKKFMGKLQCSK